jgi:cell fate regulator YaaT (PSP1 superfamily)
MPTVVGVTLRNAPSPTMMDPLGVETALDDVVVIESERGTELGRVSTAAREREPRDHVNTVDRIARVATPEDLKIAEELHQREKEAMPVYRRLVAKHHLEMKPTDVEFLFDGQRAVFYFVAEDRVDFRELVRDLAAEFHLRVDMRQIGVRDEARMVGGLGHCGEQLCCVRFGGEFQPVSIRMAKEQDLPLNPLKISGLCGRLMCCLRYEYDAYKDFKGRAPKKGAIVQCGDLQAKVVELDTPRERVTMRKEDGSRVTVALSDMECCKGQGCPCSVKAEALERSMTSLLEAPATMVQPRERKLAESAAARDAIVAPSSTARQQPSSESTPRRRRRRGGGGGGGTAAPAGTETAAAKPRGEGRGPKGGGKQATPKQGSQKQGAPKQGGQKPAAPKPPAPASGEASAPKRRRRRRRGGGGAGGGESAGGSEA